MNLLVLLQYVPRVLRIYLSSKELTLTGESVETATWIKGVLNFFMYILASHVSLRFYCHLFKFMLSQVLLLHDPKTI